MKRTIFFIVFILQVGLVSSQSPPGLLESMALKDFTPANKNIWWLKNLSGHLDHVHPVRMVLATDNKIFKGAYEMISSGEKFNLEGNFEGNEIVLIETDSLDRVTGYLKGDIIDDRFYARWSDPKNFNSLPIYVSGQNKLEACGNIGWAKYYVNQDKLDSIISMVIMKNEDDYDAILNYPTTSLSIQLEQEEKNGKLLRHVPDAFSGREEMIFDIEKGLMKYLGSKTRKPILFLKKKEVVINCKSYLNFDHAIAYTYPVLGEKKFDAYIATDFVSKYMDFTKEAFKSHNDFSISERGRHQEIGYFKFNYLNDTMLSGVFTFQSSKHPEILEIPLNYIFKARKDYKFNSGFIDKYDFNKDVMSYLNENKIKSNLDFNPEKYNIYLLHKNGIKCKTPFDVINGQDDVIIPYAYFTSKLKKKSFYK